MTSLFEPLVFRTGLAARNRIVLAPLTNMQSHADGSLGDAEFRWLCSRADGGFGVVMTCAAHVAKDGQGWPGELGVFDDSLLPGLTRLATALRDRGVTSIAQIFHGGLRADPTVTGTVPWSASDGDGVRAATEDDIARVIRQFADAAARARAAGFDGVEVHGAHGYLFTQFLSVTQNRRADAWGGSLGNRARLLRDTMKAIRARVGHSFTVGVRLSPENFGNAQGLDLDESVQTARWLADEGADFIHLSLWQALTNTAKYPDAHPIPIFRAALPPDVAILAAGAIWTRAEAEQVLGNGAGAVVLGRSAIINADWPRRAVDPAWTPKRPPATADELQAGGLSPGFVNYLRRFRDFVISPVVRLAGCRLVRAAEPTHVSTDLLESTVALLQRPGAYPDPPKAVVAIETHMSWVFLTDDDAYKLKKPIRVDGLDLGDPARRRQNCQEEVRLNRRLAPHVYLGVSTITRAPDGALALDGQGEQVDWVVRMRRLPADRMLDALIMSGGASSEEPGIRAVASYLAHFFAAARSVSMSGSDYREHLERGVRDDVHALSAPHYRLSRDRVETLADAQLALLARRPLLFEQRVRTGRIIEGHGDLRPEHICVRPDPAIIDCLEFSKNLRLLDPVDELAFLALECERLGDQRVGGWFLEAYRNVTDDEPPATLLHFYRVYRALRRATIAARHLDDPTVQDPERFAARARDYLERVEPVAFDGIDVRA